jgi:hypothetical protein
MSGVGRTSTGARLLGRGRNALLVPAIASAILVASPVTAGAVTAGGANNVVIVSASAGNPVSERSALQVSSMGGPSDASSNIADATSTNCDGCRAAAAAFQAVFITGDADTIVPANVASAANGGCTNCDSFAYAYQYVTTTQGPVFLSPAAQVEMTQLRQDAANAVASGMSDADLRTTLDSIAGEFAQTIQNDLQRAGVPAQGAGNEQVQTAPSAG